MLFEEEIKANLNGCLFVCLKMQNSYLPVVSCLGQLTVSFLQSVAQDKCFIEYFLHTKPEEGFTLDPLGKDTSLSPSSPGPCPYI